MDIIGFKAPTSMPFIWTTDTHTPLCFHQRGSVSVIDKSLSLYVLNLFACSGLQLDIF